MSPHHLLAFVLVCTSASGTSGCAAPSNETASSDSDSTESPMRADTSFGLGGVLGLAGSTQGLAGLERPDGSIAVVLNREWSDLERRDVTLTTIPKDGSPDGVVHTTLPDVRVLSWARVFADGRGGLIVVGGIPVVYSRALYVTRVGADGRIDTSFGAGGVVPRGVADTADHYGFQPRRVVIDTDGRILLAGAISVTSAATPLVRPRLAVLRLDADGRIDTTFGDHGLYISDTAQGTTDLALHDDGRMTILASSLTGDFLVRLSQGGVLDASFGAGGRAAIPRSREWPGSLIAKSGGAFVYLGLAADLSPVRALRFDAHGLLAAADTSRADNVIAGQHIEFSRDGTVIMTSSDDRRCRLVESTLDGNAVVTAKSSYEMTASTCAQGVQYVPLSDGRRAILSTTPDGAHWSRGAVRVFLP